MNRLRRELRACLSDVAAGADGELTARMRLPASFSGFQGHFPGNAVLPGVCMVQAVITLLAEHRPMPVTLRQIVHAKWFKPVGPDTELRLVCRLKTEASGQTTVKARISSGEAPVADLTLLVTDGSSGEGDVP